MSTPKIRSSARSISSNPVTEPTANIGVLSWNVRSGEGILGISCESRCRGCDDGPAKCGALPGLSNAQSVNETEWDGLVFCKKESARVNRDRCSPGSGPGTCGDEWRVRRNCVIFVGITLGVFFGTLVEIDSSFASIEGGEGSVVTGSDGGVGG